MASQEAGLKRGKKFISGECLHVVFGILLCQTELKSYFSNTREDLSPGQLCCSLNEFGSLYNLMLDSATFAWESCVK